MDPKQFEHFENILANIPPDIWMAAKSQAEKDAESWIGREWWHNKYYYNNLPNDGTQKQKPARSNSKPECPYDRKLFYPCQEGRYSLGKKDPVAYFSNNFIICCCEITEQFRDKRPTWKDIQDWLESRKNPTPGLKGYPISYTIANESILLDLTQESNLLINYIEETGKRIGYSGFFEILTHRDKKIYRITQLLSIEAYKRGIDGIVYRSVRGPSGISMPDENLVMFNEKKVTNWTSIATQDGDRLLSEDERNELIKWIRKEGISFFQ